MNKSAKRGIKSGDDKLMSEDDVLQILKEDEEQ